MDIEIGKEFEFSLVGILLILVGIGAIISVSKFKNRKCPLIGIIIIGITAGIAISEGIFNTRMPSSIESAVAQTKPDEKVNLPKGFMLLAERNENKNHKTITTSVYVNGWSGRGHEDGTFIVKTTSRAFASKDKSEYATYKGDSLELQNLLKEIGIDMKRVN